MKVETTHEAFEEFVQKVKALLEAISWQPYSVAQKEQMEECRWGVYLDRDKFSLRERLSANEGTYWITEANDGTIRVHSWRLFKINDMVELYNLRLRIDNDLLLRENWQKYREKVPGLIAELEALERIADEMNKKYGTRIKLLAYERPFLETGFDAKGMGDEEKLRGIEMHTRAMHEAWKLWREWHDKFGMDIYAETSRRKLTERRYIEAARSGLSLITNAIYSEGEEEPGVLFTIMGDFENGRNLAANRGVWYAKETEHEIVIASDNLETINTRSMEEYLATLKGRAATEEGFRVTVMNPQLIRQIVEEVSKEFDVEIMVMEYKALFLKKLVNDDRTSGYEIAEVKGRSAFGTVLRKGDMKPYRKLYEIERRAKALAEAWQRVKEMAKEAEDTKV